MSGGIDHNKQSLSVGCSEGFKETLKWTRIQDINPCPECTNEAMYIRYTAATNLPSCVTTNNLFTSPI